MRLCDKWTGGDYTSTVVKSKHITTTELATIAIPTDLPTGESLEGSKSEQMKGRKSSPFLRITAEARRRKHRIFDLTSS